MNHRNMQGPNTNRATQISLQKNGTYLQAKRPVLIVGVAIVLFFLYQIKLSEWKEEKAIDDCYPLLSQSIIEAVDYLEPLADIMEFGHLKRRRCRIVRELKERDNELDQQLDNANSALVSVIRTKLEKNRRVLKACEEGTVLDEELLNDHLICLVKYAELLFGRLPPILNATQTHFIQGLMKNHYEEKLRWGIQLDCKRVISEHSEKYSEKMTSISLLEKISALARLKAIRCIGASHFDSSASRFIRCDSNYKNWNPFA